MAESGLPVFQRDRKLVRPFQREALASGGRVKFAWQTQDLNQSGAVGDATPTEPAPELVETNA